MSEPMTLFAAFAMVHAWHLQQRIQFRKLWLRSLFVTFFLVTLEVDSVQGSRPAVVTNLFVFGSGVPLPTVKQ